MEMRPKILLVDDDVNILQGYKRTLFKHFEVLTANSGQDGINIIKKEKHFSIVVSDFRMPGLNGIEFLSLVREQQPEAVRILLTGFADAETAINAVNEGNIFRLLTKPCGQEHLLRSLEDANRQYQLVHAEKELLDKTLKGSIKILVDILSIVNPIAFKQANQMKDLAGKMVFRLGLTNRWEVEMAALLSQIGSMAIPNEIIHKLNRGEELDETESKMFKSYPSVGSSLLRNIPRLEIISTIIAYQLEEQSSKDPDYLKLDDKIKTASMIVGILNDYFVLLNKLGDSSQAFKALKESKKQYEPDAIVALDAELAGIYEGLKITSTTLEELEAGSVLADDLKDVSGTVLITRGAEISDISRMRLINYNKMNEIVQPIKVFSVS
jgi:response regulator RpfG family c-di-GMP phosphodiesterase